jgi:hypothetical protein
MGLFKGTFNFILGMGCGVYVAQDYNGPKVQKLCNTYFFMAKHMEVELWKAILMFNKFWTIPHFLAATINEILWNTWNFVLSH